MLPTLVPGEEVLALRRWRPVRVGDVVVFHVESVSSGLLVKRCVARHGGTIEVRGDNPSFSTDSRNFGLVPTRNVRYLVWLDRGAGKSRPI
jgi:signal peptidase I